MYIKKPHMSIYITKIEDNLMGNSEKQVLEILTATLNGDPIKNIDNWKVVLKELKDQAIFCLPYDEIRKSKCLSNEEMTLYQRLCYQSIAKNFQLLSEQTKLVELFESENIPFVILKGSSAAMYYSHPEYRVMGDIDIIVKPEVLGKAYAVLNREYKLNQGWEDNPRHVGFRTKGGVEIELHKYFSLGKGTEKQKMLDEMIYAGNDRREWHEIRGYKFPCLPIYENGLVLLYHIFQHFKGTGIGYRQFIDFLEFAESERENLDVFLDKAEKVGLRKLAEALLYMYEKYLGVNVFYGLQLEIDETVISMLMSDITGSGNFGRKEIDCSEKKQKLFFKNSKIQKFLFQNYKVMEGLAGKRLKNISYFVHLLGYIKWDTTVCRLRKAADWRCF